MPDNNSFSTELGGILCADCQIADYGATKLSANTIKAMRLLLEKDLDILLRLSPEKTIVQELKKITENYLHYQSDREMRSLSFVRDIAS